MYKIVSFDEINHSIMVLWDDKENLGLGYSTISLPINDGKYPEGADLEAYICSQYPQALEDLLRKRKVTVTNASSISELVTTVNNGILVDPTIVAAFNAENVK